MKCIVEKTIQLLRIILSLSLSLIIFNPHTAYPSGIGFKDFSGDVIITNSILLNNSTGIQITTAGAANTGVVTIESNVLDNSNIPSTGPNTKNGWFGIRIQNHTSPSIANNTIKNFGRSGIQLRDIASITVVNNYLSSNGTQDYSKAGEHFASGLQAKNSTFVDVSNNIITSNRFSGIAVYGSGGTIGPGNTIANDGDSSLPDTGGIGGSLTDCVATAVGDGNPRGGLTVQSMGLNQQLDVLCDNVVSNNYWNSIVKLGGAGTVTSCSNVIDGNYISANQAKYYFRGNTTYNLDCNSLGINPIDAAGYPFGIVISGSTANVTVQNCTIRNAGMADQYRATIENNSQIKYLGAGIFIANDATPSISNNYIVSNGWGLLDDRIYTEAGSSGIQMRCAEGNTSIINNVIASNKNDGLSTRESGGLIGLVNQGNTFRNNGRSGIGVYDGTTRNLEIAYNTIHNNKRGIGTTGYDGSLFAISDNLIYYNTGNSTVSGGGIGIQGMTASASVTITGNEIYDNTDQRTYGVGGIGFSNGLGGFVSLDNNRVSSNEGSIGGIGVTASNGTFSFVNNRIMNNIGSSPDVSLENVGGIGFYSTGTGSMIYLDGNTLENNQALVPGGPDRGRVGALGINNTDATVSLINNTIANNDAVCIGGAGFDTYSGDVFVSSNVIYSNTNSKSSWGAGGLAFDVASGNITISGNTVYKNTNTATGSGGIGLNQLQAAASVLVENNTLYSNTGHKVGGIGIFDAATTDVTLTANTIRNNMESGIGVWSSSFLNIQNNMILSNGLDDLVVNGEHYASGIQLRDSTFANNDISGNTIRNSKYTGIDVYTTHGYIGPNNVLQYNGNGGQATCNLEWGPGSGDGAVAVRDLTDTLIVSENVIENNYIGSVTRRDCAGQVRLNGSSVTNCSNSGSYWTKDHAVVFVDVNGTVYKNSVSLFNSANPIIDGDTDTRFTNISGDRAWGVLVAGGASGVIVRNCSIKNNNTIANVLGAGNTNMGGGLFIGPQADALVYGNVIFSNGAEVAAAGSAGSSGIVLRCSDAGTSIYNNMVYSNASDGIDLREAGAVTVGIGGSPNTIRNNSRGGIAITESSPTIQNNLITLNQSSGISYSLSNAIILINNTIISNGLCGDSCIVQGGIQDASGVRAKDSTFSNVSGNILRNNKFAGIASDSSGGIIGPDNVIRYDGDKNKPSGSGVNGCVDAAASGNVRGGILVRNLAFSEQMTVMCTNTITSNYHLDVAKTGVGTVTSCSNAVTTFFASSEDAVVYMDAVTAPNVLDCENPTAEYATLLNGTTIDASANGDRAFGVIIIGAGSNATVKNCTIKNAATIKNSAVTTANGNLAGAGIFIANSATPYIENNYIIGNGWALLDDRIYTETGASGIMMRCGEAAASIVNNIIVSNANDGLVGRETGGLIGIAGQGNTFRNNGRGGIGLYQGTTRNLEIAYNTIYNNNRGIGALDFDGTAITISYNHIYSNWPTSTSVAHDSGGIGFTNSNADITIHNNNIHKNQGLRVGGIGFRKGSGGTVSIANNQIYDNKGYYANYNSGGIGFGQSPNIPVTISNNEVYSNDGHAGVGLLGNAQFNVNDNTIRNNTGVGIGFGNGGSAIFSGLALIDGNTIYNNDGEQAGQYAAGGIGGMNVNDAEISISNNYIYSHIGQTSYEKNGIAFTLSNFATHSLYISDNTLVSNNGSSIGIDDSTGGDIYIVNNTMYNGVAISDNPGSISIANNMMYGTARRVLSSVSIVGGIISHDNTDVTIDNNYIDGMGEAYTGILAKHAVGKRIKVGYNTITNNQKHAIMAGFSHLNPLVGVATGSIHDNIISSSPGGIALTNPYNMSVYNNRIFSVGTGVAGNINHGGPYCASRSCHGTGVNSENPDAGLTMAWYDIGFGPPPALSAHVYSNQFYDIDGYGVLAWKTVSGDTFSIYNNIIGSSNRGNTMQGIGANQSASDLYIYSNRIVNNNEVGIGLYKSTGAVQIADNNIFSNANAGIGATDSSSFTITSNQICSNGLGTESVLGVTPADAGIRIRNGNGVTINSNTVNNNVGFGLSFADNTAGQSVTVTDNTIFSNGFSGISVGIFNSVNNQGTFYIDNSLGTNVISYNRRSGISFTVTNDVSIQNNVIVSNGLDDSVVTGLRDASGIRARDSVFALINGNSIRNNLFAGVSSYGTDGTIGPNNVLQFNGNESSSDEIICNGLTIGTGNGDGAVAVRDLDPTDTLIVSDNVIENNKIGSVRRKDCTGTVRLDGATVTNCGYWNIADAKIYVDANGDVYKDGVIIRTANPVIDCANDADIPDTVSNGSVWGIAVVPGVIGATIKNCVIEKNMLSTNTFGPDDTSMGGGIMVGPDTDVQIYNNTIRSNGTEVAAPGYGGNAGIVLRCNNANTQIWSNSIYSNASDGINVKDGALIVGKSNGKNYIYNNGRYGVGVTGESLANIVNNDVYSNADTGLGFSNYNGTAQITGNLVYNNASNAGPGGVGVSFSNGTISIMNNRIYANTNITTGAGGIGLNDLQASANVQIEGNTIYNNAGAGQSGSGGIGFVGANTDNITIVNNSVYNNTAPYVGGIGVTFSNGTISIINNRIYSNNSTVLGAGGIGIMDIDASASAYIEGNTVYSNTGVKAGGICFIDTDSPDIVAVGNTLYNNSATYAGGFAVTFANGTLTFTDNVVYSNTSTTSGPGGFGFRDIMATASVLVDNNSVYNNSGINAGGVGFKSFSGAGTIDNNTIENNSGSSGPGGIGGAIFTISNFTIKNNTTRNNTGNSQGNGIAMGGMGCPSCGTPAMVIGPNNVIEDGIAFSNSLYQAISINNNYTISSIVAKSIDNTTISGNSAITGGIAINGGVANQVVVINNNPSITGTAPDQSGNSAQGAIVVTELTSVTISNNGTIGGGIVFRQITQDVRISSNTSITGTAISGNNGPSTQYGAIVANTSDIDNVTIKNNGVISVTDTLILSENSGIALYAGVSAASNIVIDGNTITGVNDADGAGYYGIRLDGNSNSTATVTNNVIKYFGRSGLLARQFITGMVINDNTIHSSGLADYDDGNGLHYASGIQLQDIQIIDGNLSGNTLQYNRFSGIAAYNTDGTIGPNNVIQYNGVQGTDIPGIGSIENCVIPASNRDIRGGILVRDLASSKHLEIACANTVTGNYESEIAKKPGDGTVASCGNAILSGGFFAQASDAVYYYEGPTTVNHDCAGGTIDAAGKAFGILIVGQNADVTVTNCTIKNAASNLANTATTGNGTYIGAGIFITNNASPSISNNYFTDNGWAVLDDRIYTEAGASGIQMRCADAQTSIVNNTFFSNANDGLAIREAGGIIGLLNQGNTFKNNGRFGIGLYESTSRNLSIAYNDIFNNKRGIGINSFDGSTDGDLFTISNNNIKNHSRSGISFTVSNGISIQNNVISSNGIDDYVGGGVRDASGIRAKDSTFGVVTGNVIKYNRFSGIASYTSGGYIGPDNDIEFNGNSNDPGGCVGLVNGPGSGDGGVAVRDLDISDTLIVSDNVVENNYYGVITRKDCVGTVRNNGSDVNCADTSYWGVNEAKIYIDSNGDVYKDGSKIRTADPVIDCNSDSDIPSTLSNGSIWGLAVEAGATGVVIRDCVMYNNNRTCNSKGPAGSNMGGGLFIGPTAEVEVDNSTMYYNGCEGASGAYNEAGSAGVVMRCTSDATTIKNSTIYDNDRDGIDVHGGGGRIGIAGAGNIIRNNDRHGLGFAGLTSVTVAYNDIRYNSYMGVGVQGDAAPTISNNDIHHNYGDAGVGLIDNCTPYIYNNTIRNNSGGSGIGFGNGNTIRSNSLGDQIGLSTTDVKLDSNASSTNDYYNSMLLELTTGIGDPVVAYITDYDGATKIATIADPWVTAPSNGDNYTILRTGYSGNAMVDNNVIHDNSCHVDACGIGVRYAVDADITISNNDIYNHSKQAIGMQDNSFAEPNGMVIMGNYMHDNGSTNIRFKQNSGPINVINGNTIINDTGGGMGGTGDLEFQDNDSDISFSGNYKIVAYRIQFKNNQNVNFDNNQILDIGSGGEFKCKRNWAVSVSGNSFVNVESFRFGDDGGGWGGGSWGDAGSAEANMSVSLSNNGEMWIDDEIRCKYSAGPVYIESNGLVGGGSVRNIRVGNNATSLSFSYNDLYIRNEFKAEDDGDFYIIDNISPIGGLDRTSLEFKNMDDVYIIGNTFIEELQFRNGRNVSIANNTFYDTIQFKDCNTSGTFQIFESNSILYSSDNTDDVGLRTKHNNYMIVKGNTIKNAALQGIEFRVDSEAERGGPAAFLDNYIFSCGRAGIRTRDVTIEFSGNTIEKCGQSGTHTDEEYSGAMMQDVVYLGFENNTLKNNIGAGIVTKNCSGVLGGPPGRENVIFGNGSQTLAEGQGGNAGISIKDISTGGLVIAGNIIFSNYTDGLGIRDTSNLLNIGSISRNNKFFRNRRHGIAMIPDLAPPSQTPVIAYNKLYSNWRNGIGLRDYGRMIIRDNEIYSNNYSGIGFTSDGWADTIANNIIRNNQDGGLGFNRTSGGSNDKFLVMNNMIYENSPGGIKLENFNADLLLYFNTIADNTTYGIGDESSNMSADVTIKDTILWNNNNDDIHKQRSWGSLSVTYSDIEETWSGTGNISQNPNFVNAASDDYHVQNGSPVENAGDATSPAVTGDYDYGTRPYSGGYDMGADEQGSTAPVDTVIVSALTDSNEYISQGATEKGTLRFLLKTDANIANLSEVHIVPGSSHTAVYPDDFYNIKLYRDGIVGGGGSNSVENNFYEFDAYKSGGMGGWRSPSSAYNECSQDGSFPSSNTRDGSQTSQWKTLASDTTEPHWIEFDMGSSYSWTQVRVYSGANIRYYDVYVSTNTTFVETEKVLTGWQVGGASQWYTSPSFSSSSGRYIRLQISSSGGGDVEGEYDSGDVFLANFYENSGVFDATGITEDLDINPTHYLVTVNIPQDATQGRIIEFEISDTDSSIVAASPDTVSTPYSVTSAIYAVAESMTWFTGCSDTNDKLTVDGSLNFPDATRTVNCNYNDGNNNHNSSTSHWIRYKIGDGLQNKTVEKIRVYARPRNPTAPRLVNIYLHNTAGTTGTQDSAMLISTAEGYYTSRVLTEENVNYITLELPSDTLPEDMIRDMEYGAYANALISSMTLDTTNQVAAADVEKGSETAVFAFNMSTDQSISTVHKVNLTWATGNQAVEGTDVQNARLYEDKGVLGTFEVGVDSFIANFSYSSNYFQIANLGDSIGVLGKDYIVTLEVMGGATSGNDIKLAMEASDHATYPGITVEVPGIVSVFIRTDGNARNIIAPVANTLTPGSNTPQPATGTVSSNQTDKVILKISYTANSNSSHITGVTIKQLGTATASSIALAKLYTDNAGGSPGDGDVTSETLLATDNTLNGSNEYEFTFTPPVTVAAGTTGYMLVAVDTTASPVDQATIQFQLENATKVTINSPDTVSGTNLPFQSNVVTVSSATYDTTYVVNNGNPGTQNGEADNTTSGWTSIIGGTQSSNTWSGNQSIPFTFEFYGNAVTQFKTSLNGVLTFDTGAASPPPDGNGRLPSASLPDKAIAGFWDNFSVAPPTGSNDRVYTKTFGSSPNRQLWIKWFSMEYGGTSSTYSYFAIVLEETTNKIYMVDMNYNSGDITSTIGVQLNSTTAVEYGPPYQDRGFGSGSQVESDNDYYEFAPTTP